MSANTSTPSRSRTTPLTPPAGGHVHLMETLLDITVDGLPMDEDTATVVANAIQSSDWITAVRDRAVALERHRVAIEALR